MAIGCQLDADSDRFLISSHGQLNLFIYLPKEMELQVRRTVTEIVRGWMELLLDVNVITEVQS